MHLLQSNKENSESILLLQQQMDTLIQILEGIYRTTRDTQSRNDLDQQLSPEQG